MIQSDYVGGGPAPTELEFARRPGRIEAEHGEIEFAASRSGF